MSESLCHEEYIAFLLGIHGVVSAWEAYAIVNAPFWLQSIVLARQRRQMLEADLAWFNVSPASPSQLRLPHNPSEAGLLGSMYVMEGSTLGGQLISRHVERVLGFSQGCGDAYFRGHGDGTGAMWKEFCEVLRTRIPETEGDIAINAARSMFQIFGTAMSQVRFTPSLQECGTA